MLIRKEKTSQANLFFKHVSNAHLEISRFFLTLIAAEVIQTFDLESTIPVYTSYLLINAIASPVRVA